MSRKLKARSNEFLGVDQKVWIGLETGDYGDHATGNLVPEADGAIDFITGDVTFDIPREDSPSRSGRSVVARLSGKKTVEVKVDSYIIPAHPNVDGTPNLPPLHPFLLTVFGNVDLTDPNKIVYKLSRFNGNHCRLLEEATHYARLAVGVVFDSVTFSLAGDGKAQLSLEGFGQDAYIAGETQLAQDITGSEQLATKTMQSLDFVSVAGLGKDANLITVEYVDKDLPQYDGTVKTVVDGYNITVQCDALAMPDADAMILLLTDPAVQALINVPTLNTGAIGTDPQILQSKTNLEGGLGAYDIKVKEGHGIRFDQGSYIDIILEADGDTIINQRRYVAKVAAPPTTDLTGVNKDIITLHEGLPSDWDTAVPLTAATTGDYVIGHAPEQYEPITSEFALLGLKGGFDIIGVEENGCELISAEISMANNYTKKDFLYGTSKNCGFIPDKRREVNVKLDVLMNKETYTLYARNKQFLAEDLTITLEPQDIPGPSYADGKGRTFEFHFPKVEFNIPSIENPADGYVTLSLEGKALAPSSNQLDEEFTMTIR